METPVDYQRFVEKFGGATEYGLPRFSLWWGSRENPKMALPADFFAPYLNCWCLLEWRPSSDFGLEEEWPRESFGPYPSRGGYLPLQIFRDEQTREPAMLDTKYLNKEVLAMFMYLHVKHEYDSIAQRRALHHRLTDLKDEIKMKRIADCIEDAFPQFGEACSFTGQTNCNSALKQKMEQIEKNMKAVRNFRKRIPKGPSTMLPQQAQASGLWTPR